MSKVIIHKRPKPRLIIKPIDAPSVVVDDKDADVKGLIVAALKEAKEYTDDKVLGVDSYVLLSDDELDRIVSDDEEESESSSDSEESVSESEVDNRPRINAYNSRLDVTKELRRTSVDGDTAYWEGSEARWTTPYPYALGDVVSNEATGAWGVISLIDE